MKKPTLRKLIALTALALLAGSIEHARAQNNWTLTGSATSTSGYVIVGNSAPTDLGSLGPSTTPVFLSSGGGDVVTLDAGNTATGGNETIKLEENNDILTIQATGTLRATGDYALYTTGSNLLINNYGTITSPYDPVWEDGGSHNTINNWGMITGTSTNYGIYTDGAYFTFNNYQGGTLSAVESDAIYSDGGHLTVNNWGAISCSEGDGIDLYASNNTINNWGGGGISSANNYAIYTDSSSNTVNNLGVISSTGGQAVYITDGGHNTINNWNTISAGEETIDFYHSNDNTVNNWGHITSLTNDGIYLDQTARNTINNWGYIQGPGSYGIELFESAQNTINNWGMISGASDSIVLESSSHNTINFYGHSSANGTIAIAGSHNTVNLDFTGLSPATITGLKGILIPQGVNSGSSISATFTLRGVTYVIDPAVINFNPSSYQLQALTPNQAAVGASLDSIPYNPAPGTPLWTLFNAIDNSGNVPGALEALSPQAYEIYGDMAIENANFLVQSIDARLDNIRNGSESIQSTGMGATASTSGPEYSVAGLTKDSDGKESKTIAPPEPTPDRWGFFATGDGLFFRANAHDVDAQEGKADTAGTIVGVDGKVGDKGVVGALFSYNNSAVTMDGNLDHATIESYSGGLYGSFKDEGFYLNSLAAYTRNNYNSTRNILIPGFGAAALGSTNGNQATVNVDGGYDWNATSRLSMGPMVGLQYVHLDVDGFTEGGAGPADLAVGSENLNSLQSRLGFRTSYHLASSPTSTCSAELHAAWQHEYLDDSRGIGASFAGTGMAPFAVQTASPRRDAAVVGLGLDATFHNRLTLFADYELEIWSASYFEQSINGGMRISF